jgi:hypothetical protein
MQTIVVVVVVVVVVEGLVEAEVVAVEECVVVVVAEGVVVVVAADEEAIGVEELWVLELVSIFDAEVKVAVVEVSAPFEIDDVDIGDEVALFVKLVLWPVR